MNAYLNADEQSMNIKLGSMASLFYLMAATYSQLKHHDKRYVALLQIGGIVGELALKQRMKHMDTAEIDKLTEKVKNHQVVVGPKDRVFREMEKAQKNSEFTVLTAPEVCGWVEIDIENYCRICELKGQDMHDCYLRKLWIKHDVAPLYEDCDIDKCPYKYGKEWQDQEALGDIGEAYLKAVNQLGGAV